MLTEENLFDGTISTNTEHFYIEPASKYSNDLPKSGVHSIIYKLSDVKLDKHKHNDIDHGEHCASEQLHRKIKRRRRAATTTVDEEKSHRFSRIKNVNDKSDFNVNSNDDVISRKLSDNHDSFDVINKRSKRWLSNEEVSLAAVLCQLVTSSEYVRECREFCTHAKHKRVKVG